MNELRGFWRGKRIDNGEWTYGDLLVIPVKGRVNTLYEIIERVAITGCQCVGPSTLGECTGLRDKNGTPIFEGDIIKTKEYGKDVGHSNINDYDIFVVKYEPATFRLENNNRRFILDDDKYSKYEIIGNIHDNPELLKDVKRRKGR